MKKFIPVCAVGALILQPLHAQASGFALNEMSAASLGTAHAGATASAEDASTVFYNPAGLMRMQGHQFLAGLSAIKPSIDFTNQGSVLGTGQALSGGNGGDAGSWGAVPALYYATDLPSGLRFGIGIQSPFGLKTDYDPGWAGRYQALKSQIKTVNINPVIAWRPTSSIAVGAGVSAQYIDAELSQAVDFGSICAGTLPLAFCLPGGFLPQARDGSATVKGHDWGYGFNLGLMFTPNQNSRFGVTYRSRIRHKLSGDISFTQPAGLPALLAASPSLSNSGVSASLDLPESLGVGAYIDIDPRWSVMADLTWTRWNRFKELRVHADNGASDSITNESWRNTTRIAVGVNYRYNPQWKLRSGIAYDPTPVQNAFRNARIPDSDRTWLAFGAEFRPTPNSAWDFGYAHLFMSNAAINHADPLLRGALIGKYDSGANILSVQYRRDF